MHHECHLFFNSKRCSNCGKVHGCRNTVEPRDFVTTLYLKPPQNKDHFPVVPKLHFQSFIVAEIRPLPNKDQYRKSPMGRLNSEISLYRNVFGDGDSRLLRARFQKISTELSLLLTLATIVFSMLKIGVV